MTTSLALTRSIGSRVLGLCVSVLLITCFALGQSADAGRIQPRMGLSTIDSTGDAMPSDQNPSKTRPLRVDVDLVLVPVTVSDSMNRPVTSLKKEDFALYDENERQKIRYF